MAQDKINKKYYKKAKRISKWLNRLPFVRCVILNGSVAKGEASKSSDIDLLIVAQSGRIYTARFFCLAFLILLGLKRPRDEKANHAGKLCLNYFMTEHYLTIPHNRKESVNKHCAQNYSYSKFLAGDSRIFKYYIQCNRGWWQNYGYNVEMTNYVAKTGENIIRVIPELMCSKKLETTLRKYQIQKIESDPISKKYPSLIVYSDTELRFHPPRNLG